MIKHFDHITFGVRGVEALKQFFGLLGFQEGKSVVIAGQTLSAYIANLTKLGFNQVCFAVE